MTEAAEGTTTTTEATQTEQCSHHLSCGSEVNHMQEHSTSAAACRLLHFVSKKLNNLESYCVQLSKPTPILLRCFREYTL